MVADGRDVTVTWPQLNASRQAVESKFIPSLDIRFDPRTGEAIAPVPPGAPRQLLTVQTIRGLHRSGAIQLIAEVTNQYAGMSPDDPRLEPLWALAEELDIPVGIHIGGAEPGTPYTGAPAFRARLQSALTLEEVHTPCSRICWRSCSRIRRCTSSRAWQSMWRRGPRSTAS